jgi:hypothetical protein
MKIKFNPMSSEKGSGTTAFISFTQPEFEEMIGNIIRKRSTETIDAIEIDKDGITVRLITHNDKGK